MLRLDIQKVISNIEQSKPDANKEANYVSSM